MTRIVTSHYRYKRPPKRKKAVAFEAAVIVKAVDPAKLRNRANTAPAESTSAIVSTSRKRAGASATPATGRNGERRSARPSSPHAGRASGDMPTCRR